MRSFTLLLVALLSAVTVARPFGVSSTQTSLDTTLQLSGGGRRGRRIPTQVVVAAFNDAGKADKAADLLKDAAQAGILYFRNLAVIRKYVTGSVVIHEFGDMTVGYSATVGMFIGGMSLLMLGPAGVLAGAAAGALLGGAAQAALNEERNSESVSSIDKHRLEEVGEILPAGSSALVCVFEDVKVNKGRTKDVKLKKDAKLKKGISDLVLLDLEFKMRKALYSGKDIAFAVTIHKDRITAIRMCFNKKANDIKGMMVTKRNASVGRAYVVKEGMSYEQAEAAASGMKYEIAQAAANGDLSYKSGTINYKDDL